MAVPVQVTWSRAIPMVEETADDLEVLVQEHSAMVFRIAYSVLRNPQDEATIARVRREVLDLVEQFPLYRWRVSA